METKKVYRQLPDASKYEIAHDGEIRFVSNKRKIVVDKNGNTAIFNNDGDKITVNKATLLKEVWAKKSPGDVKQKTDFTGDAKEPKATPSAKKEKPEAAAEEVKEPKAAKAKPVTPAPKKPTAEVTSAENGVIDKILGLDAKKYQICYLLHLNGLSRKEIQVRTGVANTGVVRNAILLCENDAEKAKASKALIA